ncbi:MAG TPA: winged helix-turn-helix domain-containing protein [Acidobacteriaceae bacterium]|jgi:DNA-binding response OmpR family regulator|nr:winged helix-turn-helix domain-containing protein [Acidobacteriaceae bacterium]
MGEDPGAGLSGIKNEADLTARTVAYEQESLDLTDIEFRLLETFMQSPGLVLDREELVDGSRATVQSSRSQPGYAHRPAA